MLRLMLAWLGLNVCLVLVLWWAAHRRARPRPAAPRLPIPPDGASAAIPKSLAGELARRGAEPQVPHTSLGYCTDPARCARHRTRA
jgi:hypothetical protein